MQAQGGLGNTAFADHRVQHPDELKLDLVERVASRHMCWGMEIIGRIV
jgi:hypothetical protein